MKTKASILSCRGSGAAQEEEEEEKEVGVDRGGGKCVIGCECGSE